MQEITYYPGSCGEIIQGKIEGRDLLISCPINLFSKVRVFENSSPEKKHKYPKSEKMLNNLLTSWGYSEYKNILDVDIISEIPLGKGFASSTADLCGVYYSLAKLFKRQTDTLELMKECIKIEPSDSIVFDELTLLDYKEGRYFKKLGGYMEFHLLVFEGQRIVDTVKFNNSKIPPLSDITDVFHEVKNGIEKQDVSMMAKACTVSIMRNQDRIKYEVLPDVLKISEATDGLGVLGGHSGDVLAVIYDDIEKMNFSLKYKDSVKGYKGYPLKSLRSVEYEGSFDSCAV